MKTSNTKKRFVFSLVAVIACVAMLIGTTMAWFTDSVTSGKNRIVAGNLDVDLVMYKEGSYKSIAKESPSAEGDIFKEATVAQNDNASLWEPGKTQYVYLGVQNKGSLALKYQVVIDVKDDPNDDGIGLTRPSTDGTLQSSLEYVIIDGATIENDEQIKAAKWAGLKAMEEAQKGDILAQRYVANQGVLDEVAHTPSVKDETDYFLLAVHMKEEAGNEYQGGDVSIDVNIMATQKDAESDSFGPDYDKDALFPALDEYINETAVSDEKTKATLQADSTASVTLKTKADDPVKITANVAAGVAEAELDKILPAEQQGSATDTKLKLFLNVMTTEIQKTSVTYDISMDGTVTTTKDGNTTTTKGKISSLNGYVTVDMEIGKNLSSVSVTHSGNEMVNSSNTEDDKGQGVYSYNETTGVLTIQTKTFSPFCVSFTKPNIVTVPDGETTTIPDVPAGATITSSNPNVATLAADGTLTAHSVGSTIISVNDVKFLVQVTMFHSGDGTKDTPFIIVNKNQLKNVQMAYDSIEQSNYFKVGDGITEIDCSNWTPVSMYGAFDGNGVTFNNLDNMLFGYAKADETIDAPLLQNFTINANLISPSYFCGPVADEVRNGYAKLENIVVHGHVEASISSGFVAFGNEDVETLIFKNCYCDAEVVGLSGGTAGFIAHPYFTKKVIINDSLFDGRMTSTAGQPKGYVNRNSCNTTAYEYKYSQSFLTKYGFSNETEVKTKYYNEFDGSHVGGNLYTAEGKTATLANAKTGTLPGLGEVFTEQKVANAAKAVVTFVASPNAPADDKHASEWGCFTGTYIAETIYPQDNTFTTVNVKNYNVRVNPTDNPAPQTGPNGTNFDIINPAFGKTVYYKPSVRMVQYDQNNCIVNITTWTLESTSYQGN